MIETLLHKKAQWHYLHLTEELVIIFKLDRYAAMVCAVFVSYLTHEYNDLDIKHRVKAKAGSIWITTSRESIRRSALGLISITKVGEALTKLTSLGYLKTRVKGGGLRNEYQLDIDRLNAEIDNLPVFNTDGIPETDQPNRAAGPRKREANLITDDEVEFQLDLITDDNPLITDDDHPITGDTTIRNNQSLINIQSISKTPIVPIVEPEQEAPSRPEAVLEQEGSKKEAPADLPEDSSQFCLTNIGDWVDTISHEAIGQHLRARLVTGEREGLLALIESEGKESVARRLAEFFLDGGKSVEKFLNPPGVKQQKQKINRPAGPQRNPSYRNDSSSAYGGGPPRPTQPSASNAQKQHTAQTAALVQRWNELVPAKPANLEGSARGYSMGQLECLCADGEFMQGFDTICKKAAALIARDPTGTSWCTFSWLPKDKGDGAGPNWGKLLRGELDGLGSAGGGFKANKFSRDSLRATAEADIARRAQL